MKNRSGDVAFLMDAKNGDTDSGYQCLFNPNMPDLGKEGFDNLTSSVLRPRPGDTQPLC